MMERWLSPLMFAVFTFLLCGVLWTLRESIQRRPYLRRAVHAGDVRRSDPSPSTLKGQS